MKRIFRLNGHALLNYTDYKKVFDPQLVNEQLESFLPFATVHLVPLPLVYLNEKDGSYVPAQFWDKRFWLLLLEDAAAASGAISSNYIDEFMKSLIFEKRTSRADQFMDNGESEKLALIEKNELHIAEKADYLREHVKADDKDFSKSLCLLAICELSDEDIRNYDLVKQDGDYENNSENVKILDFPQVDVYQPEARKAPYKFKYFSGNAMPDKGVIRTVMVKAKGNPDNDTSVVIELYDKEKLVQKVTLESGDYRYVNVCGGSVVKFLPTISVNKNICIYKKNYYDDSYFVEPFGEERWELEVPEGNISMISAGYNAGSYAYITDGRVVFSNSYISGLDYYAKISLDTNLGIIKNYYKAVEVELLENNGYAILLEDGSVMSSDETAFTQEKLPYLSGNGRAGYINYSEKYTEEAVSDADKTVFYIRQRDTGEVMPADAANLKQGV